MSSKAELRQCFDELSDYYQKPILSMLAFRIYHDSLADFTLEQISSAVSKHVRGATGQFYPKVADIVKIIEGTGLSTDQIIAAARLCDTPLGLLCRIQIGSWDLKNQTDMFYLKQRAEECIQHMPEWKIKASSGDYSDHELSMLIKHKISPCSPFYVGLAPPVNQQAISERVAEIVKTGRHKFLMKVDDAESEYLQIEHVRIATENAESTSYFKCDECEDTGLVDGDPCMDCCPF